MDDQITEYRQKLVARLAQQPSELAALLEALPSAEWHTRLAEDGTSLHKLVAHLRDVEVLAFWPRVQRILIEDNPHLEAFPSHRWSVENTYHPEEPLTSIIGAFARNRAEVIRVFQGLAIEYWSRAGFHPPSGPRTVLWWAERMLTHARNHLIEIRTTLNP